jgi:hypothetical protein
MARRVVFWAAESDSQAEGTSSIWKTSALTRRLFALVVMYVGSKTLLAAILAGRAGVIGAPAKSTKRSGALRLREGRVLGAGGAGAGFLAAGFRVAGVLGTVAFFVAGLALASLRALPLAVFLGGGESSTSSLRLRLLEDGEARFAAILAVGVGSGETGSIAASVAMVGTDSTAASVAVVKFDPTGGFSGRDEADLSKAPGDSETG